MMQRLGLGVISFLLGTLLLAAETPPYRLVVRSDVRLGSMIEGILKRNLVGITLETVPVSKHNQMHPEYPASVCAGEEYFLVSAMDELLLLGCLSNPTASIEVKRMQDAIREDGILPRTLDKRIDKALQGLAAGNSRYAARLIREKNLYNPSKPQQEILTRIETLLQK